MAPKFIHRDKCDRLLCLFVRSKRFALYEWGLRVRLLYFPSPPFRNGFSTMVMHIYMRFVYLVLGFCICSILINISDKPIVTVHNPPSQRVSLKALPWMETVYSLVRFRTQLGPNCVCHFTEALELLAHIIGNRLIVALAVSSKTYKSIYVIYIAMVLSDPL